MILIAVLVRAYRTVGTESPELAADTVPSGCCSRYFPAVRKGVMCHIVDDADGEIVLRIFADSRFSYTAMI